MTTRAGTPIQRLIGSKNLKVNYKLSTKCSDLVEGEPSEVESVQLTVKLTDELHRVVQNYVRTNARADIQLPPVEGEHGQIIKEGQVLKRRKILKELATELGYKSYANILFVVELIRDGEITFNFDTIRQAYLVKEGIDFAIDKIADVGIILNEETEFSYRIEVVEVEDDDESGD